MKGALAAMVHAAAVAKESKGWLPGDLLVSAVVQEEVGGLGARVLSKELPVDLVVVGECSENQLRRGHRGRLELVVHLDGKSVHAAMPHLGVNPHYSLAPFLAGLRTLEMTGHVDYGSSTVAPTRITSQPVSANVTPGSVSLVLDWRNVPTEAEDEIVSSLEVLLAQCLEAECQARVEVATKTLVTYTGLEMTYPDSFPSFTTALDDAFLLKAQETLCQALQRPVETGVWRFATDGGHFAKAGATVIGFGPGDDRVVHTAQERVPVQQLEESMIGYAALALALAK
jgi:acetylornithine deacetylase/succinyl-diaminopimelate desuccinylase-like protein